MPSSIQEIQVFLTPEARSGDWLDFTFSIQPESMGKIDSQVRLRQAPDFGIKILPAAASAAQVMMILGIPFNVKTYILRLATEVGFKWMDEVFYDPEFQMQMQAMMMMGPQAQNSKGEPTGSKGPASIPALRQNGQMGNAPQLPGPMKQMRQGQQSGAAQSQRDMSVRPLS